MAPPRAVAIAALCAACQAGAASGPDAGGDGAPAGTGEETCQTRSGSRLRRVVRQHSDGTRDFVGMHDVDLDVDCSFQGDGDALRCRPVVDGVRVVSGFIDYIDVDCTQPIAEVFPADEQAPRYLVSSVEETTCRWRDATFALGAARDIAPDATIYTRVAGDCAPLTAGESAYYAIDREIDRPELAGGTEIAVGEGRISMRQVEGDDSSRSCDSYSLHDSELETDCALAYGEDDAIRCLPDAAYAMTLSTDPMCATDTTVAVTGGECDREVGYVSAPGPETCPRRARIHLLGEAMAGTLYWELSGTCEQFALYEGETAHRLGAAVSAGSFAAFARDWVPLGGRLERGDLVDEGGLRFHRFSMRDTEMDHICAFALAADGTERCLPWDAPDLPVAYVDSRYRDADCTQAVSVAIAIDACEGDPAPRLATSWEPDGTTRVYELGPHAAGPLYEMGTACTEVADLGAIYALGAEVAPDRFVSGSETVE